MTEPTFASLNPSLLARKGGAKPAMRPQLGFIPSVTDLSDPDRLEDLGWNDMGEDGSAAGAVAALMPGMNAPANDAPEPDVVLQQKSLATRLATRAATPKGTKTVPQGKRAAFTLRLDAERHLKLRLASTILKSSAQAIVTEALDRLLADMSELEHLAAQAKQHRKD
ncbi:hypothetical protein [Qipengyuania sp. JC766]|uniref:hypothetical protein n=1 Tax=Qipengyuania sp. JC766 TaxID=3232139 RepID=UPI00345ACF8A